MCCWTRLIDIWTAGCEKLERVKIDTVNGPRMSNYCSVTKKIPGNMGTCPEGMY